MGDSGEGWTWSEPRTAPGADTRAMDLLLHDAAIAIERDAAVEARGLWNWAQLRLEPRAGSVARPLGVRSEASIDALDEQRDPGA